MYQNRTVLDAGCGDGWLSVILAKLAARVVSFDMSPDAIRVAKARIEANDVASRVTVRTASFFSMPIGDAEFDLVIGQAILHHLRDKDAAARELRRVLRPGGKAVFVEAFGDRPLEGQNDIQGGLGLSEVLFGPSRGIPLAVTFGSDHQVCLGRRLDYSEERPHRSLGRLTSAEYAGLHQSSEENLAISSSDLP